MSEIYETSDVEVAPADAGKPEQADDLTRYGGTLEGDDYGGTLAAEEDGLPTRQDAREQTWGDNPEYYDENDLAAYYDGDGSTLAVEEEGLTTRQEARGDSPEHYDENELAAGYDGDLSTLADEEGGLPTRQEAWEQTWGDSAGEQSMETQRGLDATSIQDDRSARRAAASEQPGATLAETAESNAEHAPAEQVTIYDQGGNDVPITVVYATAEDRTLRDDSPVGIGLKPTGEELVHMEGGEKSRGRLDRLFDEAFKGADDVHDMAGNIAEPVAEDLKSAPPSGDHAPIHHAITGAVFDNTPPSQALAVNDVAGSIALMGIATMVGVRHGIARIRERK